MSTWDERPKDLKGDELIAWALTAVADAIYDVSAGVSQAAENIDGAAEQIYTAGHVVTPLNIIPGLQYAADRIGGNLERIADSLVKPK